MRKHIPTEEAGKQCSEDRDYLNSHMTSVNVGNDATAISLAIIAAGSNIAAGLIYLAECLRKDEA